MDNKIIDEYYETCNTHLVKLIPKSDLKILIDYVFNITLEVNKNNTL